MHDKQKVIYFVDSLFADGQTPSGKFGMSWEDLSSLEEHFYQDQINYWKDVASKQSKLLAEYDTNLRSVEKLLTKDEYKWALAEVKAFIGDLDESLDNVGLAVKIGDDSGSVSVVDNTKEETVENLNKMFNKSEK